MLGLCLVLSSAGECVLVCRTSKLKRSLDLRSLIRFVNNLWVVSNESATLYAKLNTGAGVALLASRRCIFTTPLQSSLHVK